MTQHRQRFNQFTKGALLINSIAKVNIILKNIIHLFNKITETIYKLS